MKLNKKILSVTMCAAVLLSVSSVTVNAENISALGASQTSDGTFLGVPNPYEDCDDLNKAYEISGVYLNAPEVKDIDSASSVAIRASKSLQMTVVTYLDRDGNDVLEIRKAVGNEDISGDYRVHDTTNVLEANGYEVTVKGNDTDIYLAIYSDGYYSYSISADGNYPLSGSDISEIVEKISGDAPIGGDSRTWGATENTAEDSLIGGVSNPYTEYSTIKEANEAAGFSLRVSKMLKGFELETVYVIDSDSADEEATIEAVYTDGKSKITVRKSSEESDISGDYNEYKKTYKSNSAYYKGESRSKISLCTWKKRGRSYSISIDGASVSIKTMKYLKFGVR